MTSRAPSRPARRVELLHLGEARGHDGNLSGLTPSVGPVGAALEDRKRGIEPRLVRAQHGVERLRLGSVEIGVREQPCIDRRVGRRCRAARPVGTLPPASRHDAGAERGDVLDALEPRRDQLACVEQLEMRRAGNVMRVADLDDGLRARERQPEVDLQRRRAVADIDLRLAARLIRIAGHDRVGRIRGMLAVDVRPAVKMRGPGR